MLKRQFTTSASLLKNVRPAVKVSERKGPQSVGKNLPFKKSEKAWDKAGESKDEYFRKRFAHIHAKQKSNDTVQRRERFQEQRDDKRREARDHLKTERHNHKNKFYKDVYQSLKPNPLSEYVYGRSPVLAVLQQRKRSFLNKLFVERAPSKDSEIVQIAKNLGVDIVVAKSKHELNLLSNNGVHNGYVLETKPLLPTQVFELGKVQGKSYAIEEDDFGSKSIQTHETSNKNPFGLYLDGITDPHNVGAIIRSAYFLGVDFIVMSDKNSAPLSPVACKTSVGATEFIPIYSVTKPLQFFDKSRSNGWTFVSAATAEHKTDEKIFSTLQSKTVPFNAIHSLLEEGPCILVLGSEGEGIRTTLKLRSDFLVAIESAPGVDLLIDSLNVSVAGALIINKMLNN